MGNPTITTSETKVNPLIQVQTSTYGIRILMTMWPGQQHTKWYGSLRDAWYEAQNLIYSQLGLD